jgi:hypothetical protein
MRKRLRRALESPDPSDALYRAINGYLADKFDLPESGMTSADARDLLEGRAIHHDAAENLVEILRLCERGRYAREALPRERVEALVEQAQASMDDFDQWIRRESR